MFAMLVLDNVKKFLLGENKLIGFEHPFHIGIVCVESDWMECGFLFHK
jgi:hypothetical protein